MTREQAANALTERSARTACARALLHSLLLFARVAAIDVAQQA